MAIKKKSTSPSSFASYRRGQSVSPQYVYPRNDKNGNANVPAGGCSAVIDKIEKSTTNSGSNSLDVFYTLTSKKGNKYYVRQRIPANTNLMECFLDFLDNAGVDAKADVEGFSGPVGTVYVTYPDDMDCFGQVTYTKPFVSGHKPKKATSMQGLLTEDDEDEIEADEDEPELDELDEEDVEEYLEEEE